MKRLLKLLFGGTVAVTAQVSLALDAQQVFEQVSPSIVVIKAGNSLGSGVVYALDNSGLTPSSTILTNCHVVKGHTQVTVERLGRSGTAIVKICDVERDIAVISLGGVLPPVRVRSTPLKVGEVTFAVGAPQGLELSISQGIVSQLRTSVLGNDPIIQTTAAISQGSSGGGLFDGEGRLIGLTTLYFKEGQALNFAMPIGFVALAKSTGSTQTSSEPTRSGDLWSGGRRKCGWLTIGSIDKTEFFTDFCKFSEVGRLRFAWILGNFNDPQFSNAGNHVYQSRVDMLAVDCRQSRYAVGATFLYHSTMGRGDIRDTRKVPEREWIFRDPTANSLFSNLIDIACK
jgi:Trypsin-like peptidase domain